MKKWLVVMMVCLFALGITGLACAQEEVEPVWTFSKDFEIEAERDLDAETNQLTSTVTFEFARTPFTIELEWEKEWIDSDDEGTLTLVPSLSVGQWSFEAEYEFFEEGFGDLEVTFDLEPFEFEWSKPLADDSAGTITATFSKSW